MRRYAAPAEEAFILLLGGFLIRTLDQLIDSRPSTHTWLSALFKQELCAVVVTIAQSHHQCCLALWKELTRHGRWRGIYILCKQSTKRGNISTLCRNMHWLAARYISLTRVDAMVD